MGLTFSTGLRAILRQDADVILVGEICDIYRGALSGAKLRTMLVDGLEKAAQGMTTLEEVLRVMDESEMDDLAG